MAGRENVELSHGWEGIVRKLHKSHRRCYAAQSHVDDALYSGASGSLVQPLCWTARTISVRPDALQTGYFQSLRVQGAFSFASKSGLSICGYQ